MAANVYQPTWNPTGPAWYFICLCGEVLFHGFVLFWKSPCNPACQELSPYVVDANLQLKEICLPLPPKSFEQTKGMQHQTSPDKVTSLGLSHICLNSQEYVVISVNTTCWGLFISTDSLYYSVIAYLFPQLSEIHFPKNY